MVAQIQRRRKSAAAKSAVKTSPSGAGRVRDFALLYVNGERCEVRGPDAFMMLSEWLRKRRGLTGTKIVCAEGDCGACSLFRAYCGVGGDSTLAPINSCITTVAQMDGSAVVTVEGLAVNGTPSPVQAAMTKCHGSQCGFCTPGFVVAMTALVDGPDAQPQRTRQRDLNALTGNLCRCTGYQPIIDAAASVKWDPRFALAPRWLTPRMRKELRAATQLPMMILDGERVCHAPTSVASAAQLMKPGAAKGPGPLRILGAGTDLGVQSNKGRLASERFLSLHLIPELYAVRRTRTLVEFGARVSLEAVRAATREASPEFSAMLNIFASPQIKNVATLVGNIANGSPIGDTLPWLLVADAEVHVVGTARGRVQSRAIPFAKLYKSYRMLALAPGELITKVVMRLPARNVVARVFKASQRKDLDISAVGGAAWIAVDGESGKKTQSRLGEVRVALGGVAATPVRVPDVERILSGAELPVTDDVASRAHAALQKSIAPISDVRGSAAFRRWLAAQFLGDVLGSLPASISDGAAHAR